MKKLKRVLAVLLTAIMTLAMATTAFAAENQGSLKVTVNQGNTLNGQTIKVYKLFDLTVSGSHYAYTVNKQYKAMIATALGQPGTATNEELYQAISNLKGEAIQKFADDFTTAALNDQVAETQASGKLGDVTEHTFNNLDFGYYLVYQTGTKEIQSSLVSVNKLEGAEVKLKGQAPSIEKTADKETVEIGEVVTYTITGVIPDTTGYEQYAYKIHDTLTDGLDFVKDANGTVVDDPNNYLVSVQIGETPATEQKAQLSGNGNRTMLLDLSQWIRDNQGSKGQTFTVKYYAKVNSAAVVETKNSAKLEYGNDPDNTTMTTPSEAKTPTYPVQIHKFARIFIGKKLSLEYQEVSETVLTDEKWLGFVLGQILSNALKYTKKGKISIYMSKSRPHTLVIEDTGIGIRAEDLPRVFEKGFTGYNGREENRSTGIGLYLCGKIMKRLDHGIRIESELGKGTKVFLELGRKKMDLY